MCIYRQYCYHYRKGQCQYVHSLKDSLDEPMVVDDEQKIDAHKIILATASPNCKEHETIENLNKLNNEYKVEIEELNNKLIKETENKEKHMKNEDNYKKEL